jgi:hypothetical protein
VNDMTPAQAAALAFVTGCAARGITASVAAVPGDGQLEAVKGLWADVARASVAAYIRANGSDPVDPVAVATEAVVPEPGRIRDEVAAVAAENQELRERNAWQATEIRRLGEEARASAARGAGGGAGERDDGD